MRRFWNLVTVLLIIYFANLATGRPQRIDENEGESEEAYYNSDDSVASDSVRDDQDSRLRNEEVQAAQVSSQDSRSKDNEPNTVKDEDPNLTWDNFSDMKRENTDSISLPRKDEEATLSAEDRAIAKRRANNYIEGSETNEQSSSEMHEKRNLDSQTKGQDLSDLIIFDNTSDQLNKIEKNIYKDSDTREDPRFQQYNQPFLDRPSKDKRYPTRERRQSQETTEKSTSNSNLGKDSEATIIKQQIQELNSQELEELLNSLSDDKKSLLKKILEDNVSDNVNKREITKKAGTVEEINGVESNQIVLSDKQGGSLITESPHTEAADLSKDASVDNPSTKITDIANDTKVELSNDDAQLTANKANLDDSSNNGAVQQAPKTESKREANDLDNFESPEEQSSDFDSVPSDNTSLQDQRFNNYKREAREDYSEVAEPMKSLQDSFPNPKAYDDNTNDSNMAPLVRVKRKDFETIKKRSANIIPNVNVAYVPYSEENEEEEAGEFEDEGFNDQVPVAEKNEKSNEESLNDDGSRSQEIKSDKEAYCPRSRAPVSTGDRENDAIGSDTDSVISGVEGVDENLMYSSGSRNKRNLQHVYKADGDLNRVYRTTPVVENDIQAASDDMNIGNYQENDAFGPLPRNYEGDLGRYKRVRHAKQK